MVIDVAEADFQREVIERSRSVPVVVDFWAEWCGPCRTLGPLLESEAAAREGDVVLAKVDVDANPTLAAAYEIRGIPAVKAFSDGVVASEFVGAQPPQRVKEFLDALVPSEAERLVAAGDEDSLRRAIELEPGRADAAVALARVLRDRGQPEAALELVEGLEGDFAAQGLAARIRLEAHADQLAPALAALDRGDHRDALEGLISALDGDEGRTEEIRKLVVGVLDELGPEHPLAREYRRRLATALY